MLFSGTFLVKTFLKQVLIFLLFDVMSAIAILSSYIRLRFAVFFKPSIAKKGIVRKMTVILYYTFSFCSQID